MQVVRKTSAEEIESHLLELGGKNQQDNMQSIRPFQFFYLLRLSEDDFFGLVFLQRPELHAMVPPCDDRRLCAVAERAMAIGRAKLYADWDLGLIHDHFSDLQEKQEVPPVTALLLRDSNNNEKRYGQWYLQDGSHRALAYAMAIKENQVSYSPQLTYLATNQRNVLWHRS